VVDIAMHDGHSHLIPVGNTLDIEKIGDIGHEVIVIFKLALIVI